MTVVQPAFPSNQRDFEAPLVRLEQLTVSYGSQVALEKIDLVVRPADRLAIIGPNGAGKTTLLRTILGLIKPAFGSINFAQPLPRIGYVPQKLRFDPAFPITAAEFLAINASGCSCWFGGVPRRSRALILESLDAVDAAGCAGQKLGTLSGGEFQRVLLAAALLQKPELLILDEPSANVDHRGADELAELLLSLHRERGMALVFVSHDFHLVAQLADRVACLNRTLCGVGEPREILSDHYLSHAYGSALRADRLPFAVYKH